MGLLHGVDLCSAGLQYAALHVVKLIVAPARPPTRQRVFVTQNAASDGQPCQMRRFGVLRS